MKTRTRHAALLSAAAVASTFVVVAGVPAQAAGCQPEADDLRVTFQPVEHDPNDQFFFRARLTLANQDSRCSLGDNWNLAFNSVRIPNALLSGPQAEAGKKQLADQGLSIDYADKARSGDWFSLKPAAGFKAVEPGERRKIDINLQFWMLGKTDAFAGFAISFSGGPAQWVRAKALQDPTDPKQTKAWSGDVRPVQNVDLRFGENTADRINLPLKNRIVPQPLSATASGGTVAIGADSTISAPSSLRNEADYLQSALRDVSRGHGARISLRTQSGLDVDGDGKADREGYTLRSSGSGVEIVGANDAAVLFGIQTLRQLISADAYKAAAAGKKSFTVQVPRANIADAPKYRYRGLGFDTTRHFETAGTVKKFIDLMAFNKLNALHLRLGDDEGWRLQIPGLPELTDFGGRRAYDPAERNALHQGMGSANDLGGGDGILGKAGGQTEANLGRTPRYQGFEQNTLNFVGKGSGSYTADEFRGILRYANERHIEVIPEFDTPAHARAAVQAMERRAQRTGSNQFRLLDPDDKSQHVSVQNYNDNLMNPCVPGTFNFLKKVSTEVAKMYDAADAPFNRFFLGGDEPPGGEPGSANWWGQSPACQNNPETAGKTGIQLMDLFFSKWNDIALKVADTTSGWEQATNPTRDFRLPKFNPVNWENVFDAIDWPHRFANEGIDVILAPATSEYLDLAYNKDPDEPGYYWARFVDDRSTFSYQPENSFAAQNPSRWGEQNPPLPPNLVPLSEEGKKHILGIEAQLFAENGKDPNIREYQAFPKLLGTAERAWARNTPNTEQMPAAFNVFSNTLGQATLPLLSFYKPVGLSGTGVNYRIPLPGGRISGGVLSANVRNPGLAIEVSTNGRTWSPFNGPVQVGNTALLRTRAADGRVSRISLVGVPAWNQGTSYQTDALVTLQGELFRAKRPNSGQSPDASPGSWELLQ